MANESPPVCPLLRTQMASLVRQYGADVMAAALAEHTPSPAGVLFSRTWDEDESKGTVELVEGAYGPVLRVNGRGVLVIDLFPPTEGEPVQLIVHDEDDQEPLAKVVLGDKLGVTLHKDCAPITIAGACPIYDGQAFYGFEGA